MKYLILLCFGFAIVPWISHAEDGFRVNEQSNTQIQIQHRSDDGDGDDDSNQAVGSDDDSNKSNEDMNDDGNDESQEHGDIQTTAVGVMNQASRDSEKDLKGMIGEVKKNNDKKEQEREDAKKSGDDQEKIVEISGVEVRGWDPAQVKTVLDASAKIIAPKTAEDLKTHTQALVAADPNIVDASITQDTAAITYQENAKLFGFIPMKIKVKTSIDAQGQVHVDYPWYARIAKTNMAQIQSAIDAAKDKIDTLGELSAQDQLKLQLVLDRQQKMIDTLSEIMKKASDTAAGIVGNLK